MRKGPGRCGAPFFFLLVSLVLPVLSCATAPRKAAATAVKSPRELAEAAQVFYEYREYGRALREYEQLILRYAAEREKYESELAWAWYEMGFCQIQLRLFPKAAESFRKVMNDFSVLAARTLAEQRLEDMKARGWIK